jgi:Domain of unknown function (DUF4126)
MDVASICAAFGLSAASGLNAWLPLFAGALLTRLDVVELAAPFDDLTGTGVIVALGGLTAADFVGDKIPAVDHVLHAAGTVIAPISGAVMFTGQAGVDTDVPTLVSLLLGAAIAESVHSGRAAVRPVSTVTTAGTGNPVLSLLEDLGSGFLVVVAFVLPVLAFLLVVGLLVAIYLSWRRLMRRRTPERAVPS